MEPRMAKQIQGLLRFGGTREVVAQADLLYVNLGMRVKLELSLTFLCVCRWEKLNISITAQLKCQEKLSVTGFQNVADELNLARLRHLVLKIWSHLSFLFFSYSFLSFLFSCATIADSKEHSHVQLILHRSPCPMYSSFIYPIVAWPDPDEAGSAISGALGNAY